MDDTKPQDNPASMDNLQDDGTLETKVTDQQNTIGTVATPANPILGDVGQTRVTDTEGQLDDSEGGPIGDTATTLLGRVRAMIKEIEADLSYEAEMARTKLNEAIHWLGMSGNL